MDNNFPRGTETILLVDDDKEVRRSTARILEDLGYKVLQAGDAPQALHMITLSNIHLLLMDVVLPGTSGLSLAEKITKVRPGIRVLYSSGYTAEEVLEDLEESGPGVGFLAKPFTAEELAKSVRALLDEYVAPPPAPDKIPRGNEAILVVEDDHAARKGTVRTLEKLGYHVLEANYADRALTIAANSKVDLVVMDVFLPGISGMSLARTIHDSKPWIRYLFVSGMASEELVEEGSPVGRNTHFLPKPFGPDELGRAVREALDAPAS